MALFLEPDAENICAEAQADLDALSALRVSAAIELKERGNEYVKMGKGYYKDAMNCYTRAIEQKSIDPVNLSILHSNRAHVHLLLGNNRYAFDDSLQATQLNKANVKAYFRGAKAGLGLDLFSEAMQFCLDGLDQDPNNSDLLQLKGVIDNELKKSAASRKQRASEVAEAEVLCSVITDRCVSVGKPAFKEHTNGRKPWLDDSKQLHWPVLLLYPEYMASDFIEDFCELDTFSSHLDVIFGSDISASWDNRHDYTRENVELFFEANMAPKLSKMQLLCHLLENKNIPDELKNCQDISENNDQTDNQYQRWIKISEKATMHNVLARNDHIIPGIPVFYVLSKGSKFYKKFLSGYW